MTTRWRTDARPASTALEPSEPRAPVPNPDDRVEAFFRTLEACMHAAPARASAIRDELESHVRDRVRDLMLAGLDEPSATDRALAELGGASALARSFRLAVRTPRSRIMNAAVTAIACCALGLGVWTATRPDDPPADPGVPIVAGVPLIGNLFHSEAHDGTPLELRIEDQPLTDVVAYIAELIGKPLAAVWGTLPVDQSVTLVGTFDLDSLARAINEQAQRSGEEAIAFRLGESAFEVATAATFDRRDIQTVCYRLDDLLDGEYDPEQVRLLIIDMVEHELWVDQGGTVAQMHSLGSVLFVKAPPRMHVQIRWIFEQLNPPDDVAVWSPEFMPDQDVAIISSIPLRHAAADGVAEAVSEWIRRDYAANLGASVISNAATNSIVLQTPEWHAAVAREFVECVDQPEPDAPGDAQARVRCFRLRHADPQGTSQLLGVVFNVSPALRQSAVSRSIEIDDNLLILTATADQLDLVERLIEIIDRPMP